MMKKIPQQGFSYIEILISLVIMSIMLLGMDSMGLYALQEEKNAWLFSVALNQIQNMSEILKKLSDENNLEELISDWNLENSDLLPKGKGTVTGYYPIYTVSIYWGNVKDRKACQQNRLGNNGCLREQVII